MSVYHKDKIRVNHVLDAIEQLIELSENKSFEDFKSEIAFQLAAIKLLEIVGEASNHISQSTKTNSPDIPWKQLVGLRNIWYTNISVSIFLPFGILFKPVSNLYSFNLKCY